MAFQVGSSLLDACVLAILIREDTYGYKLTQEIKEVLNVSESTLYPVLRRLQKDHLLETYDEAIMGRNRRYYTLTKAGKEQLTAYQEDWSIFSEKISKIFKGDEKNE